MEFQTQRLILRPWKESDAESLYAHAKNPNVGPRAGWLPHTSVENSRDIIRNVLSAPGTYAVVLKETGEVVGSIGIMTSRSVRKSADMSDHECEIGYWIGEAYWGKGLIPEAAMALLKHAFDDLGMTAVWCGHYDGNDNSRRVQEKCGFIYSHTEHDRPVPLLGEVRSELFSKLTADRFRSICATSL